MTFMNNTNSSLNNMMIKVNQIREMTEDNKQNIHKSQLEISKLMKFEEDTVARMQKVHQELDRLEDEKLNNKLFEMMN